MDKVIGIEEIKKLYPNEWVLVGNPVMNEDNIEILWGIPIFHSRDKKEVYHAGRDRANDFDKIGLFFTGDLEPRRKITGILNRIK